MGDRVASYLGGNWRKLLLALTAVLGLLVLVGLVRTQFAADRARDEALRLQANTYEVIIRAHALSSSIGRAEAALGRYVISGEKQLGLRYVDEWRQSAAQIDRLATAVSDSPVQTANIIELRRAFRARGEELDDAALYASVKRNMDALGRFYQLRQSAALKRLDTSVERVITYEHGQLVDRTQRARDTLDKSNWITQVLAGFGLLIVFAACLLGWLTVQAMAERAAADAEIETQRARAEELEQAVAAATAELRREAREREEAEAALRQAQKMEAVGQLTGGIAHDFNNMLAVVLGGLELAMRYVKSGRPEAQRHIESAMEGANRAAALTRRLLTFARADAVLPESMEMRTLIDGMSELLDRTLGDAITVRTKDAGLGWHIWVDRHQLENALLNLAVNARDAMDGKGTITIATGGTTLAHGTFPSCAPGDYVTLAVTDTGSGMAPEVLERVFEPFFTTKPVGRGTGLGLSQIFGFVRQAGGEIEIDSTLGKGTSVTIYLPRHVQEAATAVDTPRADAMAPALAESLDILVVEDDPRVLNATLASLAELGHRAHPCDDPGQAAAMLERLGPIDLLVSDVLMPTQSGPELIASLGPRLEGVGVLFVTGYAGEAADAAGFAGHPVLRKPFTISALSRAIADAMAHRDARVAAE